MLLCKKKILKWFYFSKLAVNIDFEADELDFYEIYIIILTWASQQLITILDLYFKSTIDFLPYEIHKRVVYDTQSTRTKGTFLCIGVRVLSWRCEIYEVILELAQLNLWVGAFVMMKTRIFFAIHMHIRDLTWWKWNSIWDQTHRVYIAKNSGL